MAVVEYIGISSFLIGATLLLNYVCIQRAPYDRVPDVIDDVINTYIVDDTSGLGRRFDGIGAISGGGVRYKFVI